MNLHGLDPSTVINALRFLLDIWKTARPTDPEARQAEKKKEEVLEQAVRKAEKRSAGGAKADEVVSEIGATIEKELGPAVRDEVLAQVSSIVAVARPVDVAAFHYYENLRAALNAAQQFCISTNVLQLRGATHQGVQYLLLPKLGSAINALLTREPRAFQMVFRRGDLVSCKIAETRAFFTSNRMGVFIDVRVILEVANPIGGSDYERYSFDLSLKEGSQVNRLGFHVERRPEYVPMQDFDLLLVGAELQKLIEAILADVYAYVDELGKEEQTYKATLAPALDAALAALKRLP